MKILVMGAGALGGYFGGRLVEAGNKVTFVARGAHLEALQENGLRIESPVGDLLLPKVQAVNTPQKDSDADVVLFLVKNYDVESAARVLLPFLKPDSVVVTLQNGVTAPRLLGDIIGHERVVPGIAFIPADIKAPGVVRHSAPLQKLILGRGPNGSADRINALIESLTQIGVDATTSENIEVALWTKFVSFSALSAMTALTRLDIGPLRNNPQSAALVQKAIAETETVGRVVCPELPRGSAEAQWQMLQNLPDNVHASMLDDLQRGKRLELNFLSGEVSRLGALHGIATPVHDVVSAALQPFVDGAPA